MNNDKLHVRLSETLTEVRSCQICADRLPFSPKPILQLNGEAKILIAGQAPGRKAHEIGYPFDDASGDRLRAWMGIDRATFYDDTKIAILPMGFCYPGTGQSGDLPPRPECAAKWRKKLLDLLTNIQLTLVIGRYAMDWHMPESRGHHLTEIVADWKSALPSRLALPHPSPRNNLWLKRNSWFEKDVLPLLQETVRIILE
jgi:uracil-DNA glycosylase